MNELKEYCNSHKDNTNISPILVTADTLKNFACESDTIIKYKTGKYYYESVCVRVNTVTNFFDVHSKYRELGSGYIRNNDDMHYLCKLCDDVWQEKCLNDKRKEKIDSLKNISNLSIINKHFDSLNLEGKENFKFEMTQNKVFLLYKNAIVWETLLRKASMKKDLNELIDNMSNIINYTKTFHVNRRGKFKRV